MFSRKVETLPEIKRELKDVRCCDGDSVTLECRIHAEPTAEVRWHKDGKVELYFCTFDNLCFNLRYVPYSAR